MIPMIATLQMHRGKGRVRRWCFPLFLVWLLLLPLLLVLFPVLLVVGLFIGVSAVRLYAVALRILCSLSDTLMNVESNEDQFRLCIR